MDSSDSSNSESVAPRESNSASNEGCQNKTRSGRMDNGKLDKPEQLSNSAKYFRIRDRKSLNIEYIDADNESELFERLAQDFSIKEYEHLFIKNLSRYQILELDNLPDIKSQLNNKEKTIANYLQKVLVNDPLKTGVKETLTDSFVNYLLSKLEFNDYPFLLNLQEEYGFVIGRKKVTAKIEFTIERDNSVFCLDEGKHLHGITATSEYGECQIAAEILSCAYSNFEGARSHTKEMDQTIFAVRVIGSRFTFYKAFIKAEYLRSLPYGFPPNNLGVKILRLPSIQQSEYGYDYADEKVRPLIIEFFLRLRETISR